MTELRLEYACTLLFYYNLQYSNRFVKFPRNNRHYNGVCLVVAKFKLLATFSSAAAVAMLLCPPERKHSSVCCCTQHDVGLCTGAPQLRRTGVVEVLWRRSRETSPKSRDTLVVRLSNGIIITFGDGNRVKFFGDREKPSYTENTMLL